MKPYIDVETVYGFCHNWTLVLPATKKHPAQRFWLGQDVKFCERVLGMSIGQVREEVNELMFREVDEIIYLNIPSHNTALASFIVGQLGGARYIRQQEPWAFAAQ